MSGWDPHSETAKFFPFMPVKNVTRDYPPTMLIHGTDDTDVPYEQSLLMAEQLKMHGVPHELVTIEGGEATIRLLESFGCEVGETIPLKHKDGVIRIIKPEAESKAAASLALNGHGII